MTPNDRVHRAAENDIQLQQPASTAAPVQRIVMWPSGTKNDIEGVDQASGSVAFVVT